jgi:hypothetical protein
MNTKKHKNIKTEINCQLSIVKGVRSANDGFAALLTIVIVSAAVLIMAYNASLLGLGELDLGYTSQKGGETLSIAEGCLEETLRQIRLDTNYGIGAGTINLTVSNGSCTITVADLGSDQRRVTITGTNDIYNKKIEATLTLTGNVIAINSWIEKDD